MREVEAYSGLAGMYDEIVVDPLGRTCDSRMDVIRASDGEPFTEHRRQYFLSETEVRSALSDAGLELVGVTTEYTDAPVIESTLRATWTARRPAGPASDPA